MREFTEKHQKAINLLIEGKSGNEVAAELGVHYNTISNWKNDPDFAAELKKQRRESTKAAWNVFAGKAKYAAMRIVEMIDEENPNRIQFAAACKVFDTASGSTVTDFEDRIEELEERLTRDV